MNTFYEHHQDSIRFGYRCFDRILINGLVLISPCVSVARGVAVASLVTRAVTRS